jgi:hypothetical protein
MGTEANKRVVLDAYAAITEGNLDGFMDRLTDDVRWTFFGTHRYAGTFRGKDDIRDNLFSSLAERLEGTIRIHVKNVIAEGEHVVVEARGESRTKDGRDYNNTYCIVLRLENGKIAEMREYLDTELVTAVFG